MTRWFAGLLLVLYAGLGHAHGELDPRFSGSWFDQNRSGEGFVVQVLEGEPHRALVTWFTYPPEGGEGEQAWLIGDGPIIDGVITIDNMLRPVGAIFGDAFDPDDVQRLPWGSLRMSFDDCRNGEVSYIGPDGWGSGEFQISRLTELAELDCELDPAQVRLRPGRSGPFFDPTHSGEGWMLELLGDGRAVAYWFTYDPQGRQAWMIGVGRIQGDGLWFGDMLQPVGARFGASFDPDDVDLVPWGELGFAFEPDSCRDASLRYFADLPDYGEGTLQPVIINPLAGTHCDAPPVPAPLSNGQWQVVGQMPDPVTGENGSTTVDGMIYVAGGVGGSNSFRRYDPDTANWQPLANMPGGRNHLMVTSYQDSVYVFGGFGGAIIGDLSNSTNAWRYDIGSGSWETLPNLPLANASGGATVLNDRVWVVSGLGQALWTWDPRRGGWEILPRSRTGNDDHTQAVAFEGEIWLLGGRGTSTSRRVDIFNPITREWREGPEMNDWRSGFATKVVQGQLMVAGGESFGPGAGVVRTLEVLPPGATEWTRGPNLPVPIHGNDGAVANGDLYLMSGSTILGSAIGGGQIQVYRPD